MTLQIALFADGMVGHQIADWLLHTHREDLGLVVTTSENALSQQAAQSDVPCVVYRSEEQIARYILDLGIRPSLGILAWWPRIIKQKLLGIPQHGFINTHPSLLPFNRGKHYNFWAIVEQVPFGVSLHFVETGIDSGDIIAQRQIEYDWEDTGKSLYVKAQNEMVSLFTASYPRIRRLQFERRPQPAGAGSYHHSAELAAASQIDLDRQYTARDLLNRLRARTFEGHPACWFEADGKKYEVRTQITRVEDDTA